jgi:hypothetical protein
MEPMPERFASHAKVRQLRDEVAELRAVLEALNDSFLAGFAVEPGSMHATRVAAVLAPKDARS